METEELIKLVDGIYKNILDKFNPGARQMINAGKAYLKALHGAAAASRLYVDAITKLARQAQQGTWGGSSDIGSALMKIVEVYKEIQEQQMNILKAFYVDLLVPLETNLEKDTKVVQSEQKKFLQQHKQRSETYSKAAAMMKKQRKKSRGSTKTGIAMDKELKNMQVLEEEKTKLDAFCEQSLKTAMTQERRRYGFVLERQCSLAKHHLSYHSQGVAAYQQNIEEWSEVAKTREFLPEPVENMFTSRMRQVSFWPDEDLYSNPRSPHLDDDRLSITSQLRKTKSMDASCLDIRSIGDASSPMLSLSRAKSDFNLTASTHSLAQDCTSPVRRPKSMALPPSQPPTWDVQLARALYAYLSSGENQLSFLEGDVIALMGDRNKGWQFGENLRTQCSGWFPLAYTEILDDPTISPSHRVDASGSSGGHLSAATPTGTGIGALLSPGGTTLGSGAGPLVPSTAPLDQPTSRMFGDTLHLHRSSANAKQIRRVTGVNNYVPPPALPAPVPTPTLPFSKTQLTQSQSTTFSSPSYPASTSFPAQYAQAGLKTSASSFNFTSTQSSGYSTHPQGPRTERPPPMPPLPLHLQTKGGKIGGAVGNVSLHSSNDSGFSNDPPPQPEVDYSDDESSPTISKVPIRKSQRKTKNDDNNNPRENTLPLRPSNSSGNLVESRPYLTDEQRAILRQMHMTNTEKKGLIKRTKSFWRFGKHSSDSDILEGMSMWKHRDLVDVPEQPIAAVVNKKSNSTETNTSLNNGTTGSERSNDSDKTLNAKQSEETGEEIYGTTTEAHVQKRNSFSAKQKLSLPIRKDSETGHDIEFENHFGRNRPHPKPSKNDQFYDDEGDGLMLRTVNRKDILKQYNNDSTVSDTDSDSEITSDDPYDCIVVDDHTTSKKSKRNMRENREREEEKFPNVAETAKKLEQFSKSNKYSPDSKENNHLNKDQYRNSMNNKINKMNARNKENNSDMSPEIEHQEILTYRNRSSQTIRSPTPEPRHSFKTFGHDENGPESKHEKRHQENHKPQSTPQPEVRRKQRNYSESHDRDVSTNERRSKYSESHEKNSTMESNKRERERERRPNPESRNRGHSESERQEKYYIERQEPEDANYTESRQFLPRTKLVKSNSIGATMQTVMKFEQEIVEYGDLNLKHKKAEYGAKYEDIGPNNGNIYGPWYDLWGLDATVQK